MYKVIHDPDGWYVYHFSEGHATRVAGPYSFRQSAFRRKKQLTLKASENGREETRSAIR